MKYQEWWDANYGHLWDDELPGKEKLAEAAWDASAAAEQGRIRREVQELLDGDFCGSDIEALECVLGIINEKPPGTTPGV